MRARIGLAGIALLAILTGVSHLAEGGLSYQNWWGGLVFVPFVIVFGVLILCLAIFWHPNDRKAR
jgi:hypothetical protein